MSLCHLLLLGRGTELPSALVCLRHMEAVSFYLSVYVTSWWFMLCYWEQPLSVSQIDSKASFFQEHVPEFTKCKKLQNSVNQTFQSKEKELWKKAQEGRGLWAWGWSSSGQGCRWYQGNKAMPALKTRGLLPSFSWCLGVPSLDCATELCSYILNML